MDYGELEIFHKEEVIVEEKVDGMCRELLHVV